MNYETLAALYDKCGETLARSILMDHGTRSSRRAFERMAEVRYARERLEKGASQNAAAFEVRVRYELPPRTAYRRTEEALRLGPRKSVPPQGPSWHNSSLSLEP